ncbi:MAG: alpha/beta hydrolase, partial [Leptospiraceae bacterium]|nr:alpha/beta hydrolase [Leptospiraceae bacterium]
MSILMFPGCSSHSGVLFYRPPGTTTEVYKTHPEALQLTVYPESTPGIHTGAVVFIHGGGWQAKGSDLPLYWDWHARVQNAHLRAFSLEHRAAPTYRGHDLLEDTLDAVAYIRQHANRFRIPPDKIALVGFSSGGHLAVLTALAASTPRPGRYERHPGGIRAAISFYGPLDPEGLLEYGNPAARNLLLNYLPEFRDYSANQSDGGAQQRSFLTQSLKDISPIYRLHYRAPRMLLLHGAKDE